FEAQLRIGGVETLMDLAQQVRELRAAVSRLSEILPDIEAQMAFPIGSYERFREIYDIPPPPRSSALHSSSILLLADRETLETIRAQILSVRLQTYERWALWVIGADPARRRVTEEAAAGDVRI